VNSPQGVERWRVARARRPEFEGIARAALAKHSHFVGRAEHFCFAQCQDVLIVNGQVPSFYLKQLVQCVLSKIEEVRRVINQVEVICPYG